MTKYLLSFLLLLNISLQAQERIYYDAEWKISDQNNYSFYREKTPKSDGGFFIKDFFKGGRLQMEGSVSSTGAKEGMHHFYFATGKLESSGNYLNGNKDGEWKNYFPTGEVYEIEHYINGVQEGSYKSFYKNGNMHANFNMLHDSIVGNKLTFYENGLPKRKEIYEGNSRKTAICYDANGKIIPFYEFLIHPEFIGGEPALIQYLSTHINYPEKANIKNIQGRVVIHFSVGKDGKVINARVGVPVNPLLDAEALRVVKNMPSWIPGKLDGEIETLDFNLPVYFTLTD